MLQQKQRTSYGPWMIESLSLQGSSLRISRYSTWLLCVFTALLVLLLSAGGYPSRRVTTKPAPKVTLQPSVYYGVHVPGWL